MKFLEILHSILGCERKDLKGIYIIYTSLAMIPEGFTCSASIAHSLVSISLKSMEHSSFLRAPSDFVPHKKLHASKFGHIAIL